MAASPLRRRVPSLPQHFSPSDRIRIHAFELLEVADMSGFEDKIGMKTTLIASDPQKIAGHPYAPLSDEDRAELQAEIDEMNQAFIAAIARGRGIDAAAVPGIHGAGRTFSAGEAAKLGVTDGVMTLRDVVAKFSSSRTRLALMRRRAEARAATF